MRTGRQRQARFIDLVQAHQGATRGIAAPCARGPADREGFFQESALQPWRAPESFREESAFSTFLCRAALSGGLPRGASTSWDKVAG